MYTSYLCGGFCHQPTTQNPQRGRADLAVYNPGDTLVDVSLTIYFTDRPPAALPVFTVAPGVNRIFRFPEELPQIFADCGFWGAKSEASSPVILSLTSGFNQVGQKEWLAGGATIQHGTNLDTVWQFPDGLWLEWVKHFGGDKSKSPFPFNEIEHYFVLNPHDQDIHINLVLQYQHIEPVTMQYPVKAQSVFVWDNFEKVAYVKNYCMKIQSSQPVACSAVRYIYDLDGFAPWGIQVHCAMIGIPGKDSSPAG